MKCISLWQPHATFIVIGAKPYETRSWPTSYRGPILIHAAKKRSDDDLRLCLIDPFNSPLKRAGLTKIGDLPFGAIVGVARIVEVYQVFREMITPAGQLLGMRSKTKIVDMPAYPENQFGDFSIGRYAWKLEGVQRFATPIPYRGAQGIFDVPEEAVAESLRMAVAA